MQPLDPLDDTPEAREALGRAALDWCLRYVAAAGEEPVYPRVSAGALREALAEPLPRAPQPPAEVFAQLDRVAAASRKNVHPRMFGYVQSSGTLTGALADLIVSTLNQNVTSWRSAPGATTVELQVLDWIKALVGVAPEAGGLLVGGGSMANMAGLAVALRAHAAADVNRVGLRGLPRPPVFYASTLVHMSIPKGLALLGVGEDALRLVDVDEAFRIRPEALTAAIEADRRAGLDPVCVVANAGDVNTGAVDPLPAIADVCERLGVWLHVDGAYGGFAAMAPSAPADLAALGRADSVSLDPHKWLFAPLDAGCLLVRDPAMLAKTFTRGASYIDVVADADMSAFAFWNHGPELSRRFRALKLWFMLKLHGADVLAGVIDAHLRLGAALARMVDESDEFERLAPAPLSIVCFRHVRPPAGFAGGLDAWNRALMIEVQRGGAAYLSNAQIGDAFALRACIVNHRTREGDLEGLLAAIRDAALRLGRP